MIGLHINVRMIQKQLLEFFKAINLQASQMLQKYDMSYFQKELENKEKS